MYLLLISTFLFCEAALSANIKAQAGVVDLDEYSITHFMKENSSVAFLCRFDSYSICHDNQFLTAAKNLNEEKIPIKFGKMNLDKHKPNIDVSMTDYIYVFFCWGRYIKFWDRSAEAIEIIVKDYKKKCDDEGRNSFPWEYEVTYEEAVIVDLNQKNIKDFVKNKYAVAFFCDFDNNRFCKERKDQFLTAADKLNQEKVQRKRPKTKKNVRRQIKCLRHKVQRRRFAPPEKIPIEFGIMDHIKNKWIKEKIKFPIKGDIFMFFCQGRYAKFPDRSAEAIEIIVKDYKKKCDDEGPNYFPWEYKPTTDPITKSFLSAPLDHKRIIYSKFQHPTIYGSGDMTVTYEEAVVDLNQKNIKDFVKNKYAVAFFCDFDNNRFCKERKDQFLKAADKLNQEKVQSKTKVEPIEFGIMDHIKNEWIKKKITVPIKGDTFVFFCQGRYTKLSVGDGQSFESTVKEYKENCDRTSSYFHWEYKE